MSTRGWHMVFQVGFLLLVAVTATLAAAVGALLGSALGRGMAIDAAVAPLRADVVALVDKFDHASKRWSKRDRDGKAVPLDEQVQRTLRLREIAASVGGKGGR